jgi:hypothetical protein
VRNVDVTQVATPETTGALWQPAMGAPFDVKATVPVAELGLIVAVRVVGCEAAGLVGATESVVVVVVVSARGVMVMVPLP